VIAKDSTSMSFVLITIEFTNFVWISALPQSFGDIVGLKSVDEPLRPSLVRLCVAITDKGGIFEV